MNLDMNKERYINKLNKIKEAGNYRVLRDLKNNGFLVHEAGREMLNLSSNDYLGLASNPKMRKEFFENTDVSAIEFSAVSSRLLSGNHEYYKLLEDDLATLFDREAALVFNSGYHANIGIIPALTSKKDLILADKFVHASMIDGLRLSEAEMVRYRHLDYEQIRHILMERRDNYENVFIITESIFSMDGDIADLQQLCEIKKEFDTFLYVDEAHAFGVRGTNGLGCCEEQGCIADIDFIVGTFGKALASVGAFVVCDDIFREYLINTQRSLIFTTALPPINVAWTRFLVNRLSESHSLRMKLIDMSNRLRKVLIQNGYHTDGDSHIVPMMCGSNENSITMSDLLRDNGFFALPVRYPTVPKNRARIRFSLNAAIPMDDFECLIEFLNLNNADSFNDEI